MKLEDLGDFEQPFKDVEVGEGNAGKGCMWKKRVRDWTAEDRARHRVFERGRRGAFNERLTELASLLPNLKNAKDAQLPKHAIVDESLKHHRVQEARIQGLTQHLDELRKRHEQLLQEVSQWQAGNVDDVGAADLSIAQCRFQGELVPNGGTGNAHTGAPGHAVGEQSRRSVLPELGTYPDSLVHLPPDSIAEEETQGLDGFAGCTPARSGHVKQIGPENMKRHRPNSVGAGQNGRPFDGIQDPAEVSQYHLDSFHPPLMPETLSEWNSMPRNMQDLRRMQLAFNQTRGWVSSLSGGEYR